MPSKYAHVVGSLPKLGLDPERKQLIDAVKAEILAGRSDVQLLPGGLIEENVEEASDCVENALDLLKYGVTDDNRHAAGFAAAYAKLRGLKDEVDAWKASVQLLLDAYEQLMLERMEVEGVTSLKLESGASVSTYDEPYGQVKDKEVFRLWCIASGYEAQLQLWPSTMNAIAKERCLAGEPPPDGVEVFSRTMLRLNKGR